MNEVEHAAFCEEYAVATFAIVLATEMKRQKVSQRKLARLLGVSEGRVSQMLRADANLTIKTVARVAAVLGCHLRVSLSPVQMASNVRTRRWRSIEQRRGK